ncbi:MAG: hypothetical protein HKL80_06705 [Acidimicrobiales bacterium]|nr:hypothetical protein [Acidimicrobiales bacterium]
MIPNGERGLVATMQTQSVLYAIATWFAKGKQPSLELPSGWFGRPYDNLHVLTWSAATEHKVLVELDGQLLLVITDPGTVVESETELIIKDCAQVVLDWQEYGSLKPHADNHGPGSVRFLAHGVTVR